jgi:hypothetical protein
MAVTFTRTQTDYPVLGNLRMVCGKAASNGNGTFSVGLQRIVYAAATIHSCSSGYYNTFKWDADGAGNCSFGTFASGDVMSIMAIGY